MRGRDRFRGRNRRGGAQAGNQGNQQGQRGGEGRPPSRFERGRDDRSRGGAAGEAHGQRGAGQRSRLGDQLGISGFDLFCAYHLGITADDKYAFQNIHQVARRFNTNAGVVRQLLEEYLMDPERMVHSSFDMAAAQVDIMVAPEGISRRELARSLYDEFVQAPRKARDWARELDEAARENERTFGPRR
jgi:hypothetical protein